MAPRLVVEGANSSQVVKPAHPARLRSHNCGRCRNPRSPSSVIADLASDSTRSPWQAGGSAAGTSNKEASESTRVQSERWSSSRVRMRPSPLKPAEETRVPRRSNFVSRGQLPSPRNATVSIGQRCRLNSVRDRTLSTPSSPSAVTPVSDKLSDVSVGQPDKYTPTAVTLLQPRRDSVVNDGRFAMPASPSFSSRESADASSDRKAGQYTATVIKLLIRQFRTFRVARQSNIPVILSSVKCESETSRLSRNGSPPCPMVATSVRDTAMFRSAAAAAPTCGKGRRGDRNTSVHESPQARVADDATTLVSVRIPPSLMSASNDVAERPVRHSTFNSRSRGQDFKMITEVTEVELILSISKAGSVSMPERPSLESGFRDAFTSRSDGYCCSINRDLMPQLTRHSDESCGRGCNARAGGA